MWIHIPNLNTSASTQEEADSTLPSNSQTQVLEQSVTWRGKHRVLRSWLTTCKRTNWMMRLSLQIPEPSMANHGVEKWISSLEDSLVSPPASLEEGQDKTMSDGFSLTLGESCQKRSHRGCSWRMCEDSYQLMVGTDSKKSSGTWPTSGTMLNGVFIKRPMLEPVIDENGHSSMLKWPTPDTTDRNYKPKNFRKDTNFNPETGLGRHSVSLGQVVSSWSTPTARDVKGVNKTPKFLGQLPNQVAHEFVPSWREEYSQDMNWPTPDTMPEAPNQNSNVKNRPKSLLKAAELAQEVGNNWASPTTSNANDKFKNRPKDPTRLMGQVIMWSEDKPKEWPTPTTQEYPHSDMELNEKGRRKPKKGKTDHSLNLQDTAATWATPDSNQSTYSGQGYGPNIREQAANWSTPMAGDDGAKATVNSHQRGLISDADHFHGRPVQQALSGDKSSAKDPTLPRLNPKFVEWLMGWPEDWVELTNFAYLETE